MAVTLKAKQNSGDRGTKEKIMNVALQHFSRFGFEGVKIRRILLEANVNQALAHYHFGSKKAIFEACVWKYLEQILQQRKQSILSWTTSRASSSKEDLVIDLFYRYVEPHFRATASEGGVDYSSVMQAIWANPGEYSSDIQKKIYDVRKLYMQQLGTIIPDATHQLVNHLMNALGAVMLTESIPHAGDKPLSSGAIDEQIHARSLFTASLVGGSVARVVDIIEPGAQK